MMFFLMVFPVYTTWLLFLSVAGEFTGEEGGSRIDRIDLTSGEDRVLVTSDIGAVSGMTVDWDQEGHLLDLRWCAECVSRLHRCSPLRRPRCC